MKSKPLLKVDDRIKVLANPILGTEETMGTILEVEDDHYLVLLDGDDPDWYGPVSFDGQILN